MAQVLVVEDAPAIRLVIHEELVEDGHTVVEAENGRVALDIIRSRSFDLVITDIVMPDVDGFSVMRAVRAAQPMAKILAITGHANTLRLAGERDSGVGGADIVLLKPFLNSELRDCVSRLL